MLKGTLEGIVVTLLASRAAYGYEALVAPHSLNPRGRAHLDEFRRTWSFLAGRLEQLRRGGA